MDYTKDKMVALRLSSVDLYMISYVFCNEMGMVVNNCPAMVNVLVRNLKNEIVDKDSAEKIKKLMSQYEKLKNGKPFRADDVDIAGTKLSVGKPYNVFVDSKVIGELQNYIIKHTEIKKPHSSWIIQLSILNAFLPRAKSLGDFDIEKEKNLNGEQISEFDKIDMIEKFARLLKNTKQNIDKIKQIKEILEK